MVRAALSSGLRPCHDLPFASIGVLPVSQPPPLLPLLGQTASGGGCPASRRLPPAARPGRSTAPSRMRTARVTCRRVYGMEAVYVHDAAALAAVVDPSLFDWAEGAVVVVTDGPAKGRTIRDEGGHCRDAEVLGHTRLLAALAPVHAGGCELRCVRGACLPPLPRRERA